MANDPLDQDIGHALLIGVGARDVDAPGMEITASDARYLQKTVIGELKFPPNQVVSLTGEHATKNNILRALDHLIDVTSHQKAGLVIIYFSGHGSQSQHGYHLICRDTLNENPADTALAGSAFALRLVSIQCEQMIVLLDCCHSGGMTHIPFNAQSLLQFQNRIILTACDAQQVSYLSRPMSVFTYALVEALSGKFVSGKNRMDLRVFDLAMDVRERVVALSQQVLKPEEDQKPQLQVLQNSSTNNFIIRRFAKEGPHEVRLIKEELISLMTPDGKAIDVEVRNTRDESYRNQFNFIFNQGEVVVSGTTGDVYIDKSTHITYVSDSADTRSKKERVKAGKIMREAGLENTFLSPAHWAKPNQGEESIVLRFDVLNLSHITFSSENLLPEFAEKLEDFHTSGIVPKQEHFDTLSKLTIENGNNLLKSNGIFGINYKVISPISKVIGQYLFRLLFGEEPFVDLLRWAKENKRDVEIHLQFHPGMQSSRELALLPWELMYCPQCEGDAYDLYNEATHGFFVSQSTSLYRKYTAAPISFEGSAGSVSTQIGILSQHKENLNELYNNLTASAEKVMEANPMIDFSFVNDIDSDGNVALLSREQLIRMFQNSSFSQQSATNKILHLICDMSSNSSDSNTDYELYFSKNNDVQSIPLKDILEGIFVQLANEDPALKCIILQSWNHEEGAVYMGFEHLALRLSQKSKATILTMPYLMNQHDVVAGQKAFFEILYSGIAHGMPFTAITNRLRSQIVQAYSYGFPVLYLNTIPAVIPQSDVVMTSAERTPTLVKKTDPGPFFSSLPDTADQVRFGRRSAPNYTAMKVDQDGVTDTTPPDSSIELSDFEKSKIKKRDID